MSEQQGLWYEISLTNRQVLAAFLILLACIVGAFLSGVWVGREAMAGEGPLMVASSDLPESGDSFQFFGQDEGDEATDAPAGSQAAPAERANPPVTVRRPENDQATEQDEAPARERRARPEPSPAAADETAESSPELSPSDLIIQVFSSAEQSQARSVLSRLRNGGFDAFLSPVTVDGRTMFRVRVGPFSERQQAERVAAQVKREQRLDTWITSAAN